MITIFEVDHDAGVHDADPHVPDGAHDVHGSYVRDDVNDGTRHCS